MSMKQLLARRMVSPRLQHGEIAYGPAIDDKIALFQQAPHTYACCMPVDRFNAAGAMTAANLVMAQVLVGQLQLIFRRLAHYYRVKPLLMFLLDSIQLV